MAKSMPWVAAVSNSPSILSLSIINFSILAIRYTVGKCFLHFSLEALNAGNTSTLHDIITWMVATDVLMDTHISVEIQSFKSSLKLSYLFWFGHHCISDTLHGRRKSNVGDKVHPFHPLPWKKDNSTPPYPKHSIVPGACRGAYLVNKATQIRFVVVPYPFPRCLFWSWRNFSQDFLCFKFLGPFLQNPPSCMVQWLDPSGLGWF